MSVLSVNMMPMPVGLGMVHADDAMFRHFLMSMIGDLLKLPAFRDFDPDRFVVGVFFCASAASGCSPE